MSRFHNFDEVYSALYVDFDNIYTRLAEQDVHLARTFATTPQRWLRWIEGHALRMMYGDGVRRRILKRCCYLNPHRYHEFRPFFIRAAFQVVDCPPLTNYGKTSADIHLVMDCMDALAHTTRFDEIIILSGDADFTPLLLRIQEHARRSIVLSVGYTSPAYVAACSWRIREDWFIAQALEENTAEGLETREERFEPRPENDEYRTVKSENRRNGQGKSATQPPREDKSPLSMERAKRRELTDAVKRLVEESSAPMSMPTIAQYLQQEHETPSDWYGAGTLKALLLSLDLTPLEMSPAGQGYLYDPEQHSRPEDTSIRDDFRQHMPELFAFALKAHQLTDLPLLKPDHYAMLLIYLAEAVENQGFSHSKTIRGLEERFEEEGLSISAIQISFVIDAIIRGGFQLGKYGKGKAILNLDEMRRAFLQRAVELCRLSQLSLDNKGQQMLASWLCGAA
jgi:hypothetical protein